MADLPGGGSIDQHKFVQLCASGNRVVLFVLGLVAYLVASTQFLIMSRNCLQLQNILCSSKSSSEHMFHLVQGAKYFVLCRDPGAYETL